VVPFPVVVDVVGSGLVVVVVGGVVVDGRVVDVDDGMGRKVVGAGGGLVVTVVNGRSMVVGGGVTTVEGDGVPGT
jgi:hypothetical protein